MSQVEELTTVVKQWWDLELYETVVPVDKRSSQDKHALFDLKNTKQYKDVRCSMGIFWNGQQKYLQNNYPAALSQLKWLETRLNKDENLKERFT